MRRRVIFTDRGFSFVEMLVAITLAVILLGAGGVMMISGHETWSAGDAHIKMQENVRLALDRMASELRLSNTISGQGDVQIIHGAGLGGSDAIKFSIPVVCQTGAELMINDAVAHWGAPLRWGCRDSSCMDADNNCATIDYKYIYYTVNANGHLERRVLDSMSVPVVVETMAPELTDLRFFLNGSVLTITVTVQEETQGGRIVSYTTSQDVYLRN